MKQWLSEITRIGGQAIDWLVAALEGPADEDDGIDQDMGAVPPGPRLRDLVLVVRGVRIERVGYGQETRLDDACPVIAGRSWPEWMEIAAAADAALAAQKAVR